MNDHITIELDEQYNLMFIHFENQWITEIAITTDNLTVLAGRLHRYE